MTSDAPGRTPAQSVPADAPTFTGAADWVRVSVVWAFALAAGVLALVLVPADSRIDTLLIVITSAIILAFVLQLSAARASGFILRMAASVTGAAAVLGVLSGIAVLLGTLGR